MKRQLRENYKEFKIERGLFDNQTMMILYNFLNKCVLKEIVGIVKEGKESGIFLGKDKNNEDVAIKIYRTLAADFKAMWKYLIEDKRFFRIKKDRRFVVNQWCLREYKNLKMAYEAGVNCPKPIIAHGNILIMKFIGDNGVPAPRLIDIKADKKDYNFILNNIKKLVKAGLIHGDLSAYNILMHKKPIIIDFSHTTTTDNILAPDLLKRDIENINSYFSKLKIPIRDSEKIYLKLKEIISEKND